MRITIAIVEPDGGQAERLPTEAELQGLAERYAQALLEGSLPGSRVTLGSAPDGK